MTAVKSGLMIIDQHRAHLRILFEEYQEKMRNHRWRSQGMLFPEIIKLSLADGEVMRQILPDLADLGFSLNDLGGGSFSIDGIPAGIEGIDVTTMLNDLLMVLPQHFEARLSLAVVLQQLGRKQEALDNLNQAIQQYPDSAVAYAARANLERDMKQDEAALYDWQKAEKLSPKDPTYVVSHVDLLLVLERRKEARRVLDAAVSRGVPRGMLLEWYAKCKR